MDLNLHLPVLVQEPAFLKRVNSFGKKYVGIAEGGMNIAYISIVRMDFILKGVNAEKLNKKKALGGVNVFTPGN